MSAIRAAIILAGGLVGMFATFHPTFTSGFTQMQPDPGDVVLNNYFLEHTYRWAFDKHYPHSFWSPGFFYPTPDTFAYSETLIGAAPVYWALRPLMEESLAVQGWILLMFAANYLSCAVVLRWFGVNIPLTVAGAYVFAFGLLRTDHLGHQHLMPHLFTPFAVWYAWRFLEEPTVRRWVLILGLLAWQVFASLHLGWFLWFGLLLMGLLALVQPAARRRLVAFVKQRPWGVLLPAVVALVVVGMYAKNFYRGATERRAYLDVFYYAPTFDAWLVSPEGSLWGDHLTPRVDRFDEMRLFHGLTAYGVLAIALVHAWRTPNVRRPVGLLLGTAFLLALSVTPLIGTYSLWYPIHSFVPGANAFRAIGRIALMVTFVAGLGGLLGFQHWLNVRPWSARRKTLVAGLIAVLIIGEQVREPRTSFAKVDHCYGPASTWTPLLHGANAGYVVFDGTRPDYEHHITAMWAGLQAGVPMLNGFSGSQPTNYPAYEAQPTLEELLECLGPEWQGTLIVIHPGPPPRRYVYRISTGPNPTTRFMLVK